MTTSPASWSYRPDAAYNRNSGVINTCGGSRLPAVKKMSKAMLKRWLSPRNAHASPAASASTSTTDGMTTSTVLAKWSGNEPSFQART
jgi:hypothetical protein